MIACSVLRVRYLVASKTEELSPADNIPVRSISRFHIDKRFSPMNNEISRLLASGSEQIVRSWSEKVMSDRRVQADAQLSYVQLIDHVPQIIDELKLAMAANLDERELTEARKHGRQRWQQGYELKEVIRELILLRSTLLEFIEAYRGALRQHNLDQLTHAYRKINGFIDEELYKTVEAYLEAPKESRAMETVTV